MPAIPELIFYALINYIPYTFLALYPFGESLRFSKRKTAVIFCAYSVAVIALFTISYCLGDDLHVPCTFLITLLSIITYFVSVKARWGRMLFNLFMIKNIANFVVITAKCLEGQLFPASIGSRYCWTNSLCMLFILIPLFPLIIYIIRRFFSKKIRESIKPGIWHSLWMIPAFFYGTWLFVFYYSSTESSLQLALKPVYSVYMIFSLAVQLLIYICIAKLVIQFNHTALLEEENNRLISQSLQYRSIQERIQEVSRIKHDMRHHMITLCSYADSGKYEDLQKYLHEYIDILPDNKISYCANAPLNILLVYYEQRCLQDHISFRVKLQIPETPSLSDTEITVLFGNLLENAAEACAALPEEERFINVSGKCLQNRVVFVIQNSFCNDFKMEKGGAIRSTKHSGYGIGTASVKSIVTNHQGELQFSTDDHVFAVSILLPAACKEKQHTEA